MTTENNQLKSLDLSEKEQKLFEALLRFGLANPTTLAKKISVKRPSVYIYLEKLQNKGLIIEVKNRNKKYFKPVSGSTLKHLIHSKILELKKLEKSLPKQVENSHITSTDANGNYLIYDGIQACQNLANEIARSNEDLYFMGSLRGLHKFYPGDLMEKTFTKPRRKRFKNDYLITDWDKNTIRFYYLESELFTLRRFLPKNLFPKGSLVAYGNKLVVVNYYPNPHAVVMEDEDMVTMFKMAFFSLWKDLEGKNIPPHP